MIDSLISINQYSVLLFNRDTVFTGHYMIFKARPQYTTELN